MGGLLRRSPDCYNATCRLGDRCLQGTGRFSLGSRHNHPFLDRKGSVMTRVLMLASFGLEIVECGGALARHIQAGDDVHAAVLLSRPESRPQVREAAGILGIEQVEFLDFPYG